MPLAAIRAARLHNEERAAAGLGPAPEMIEQQKTEAPDHRLATSDTMHAESASDAEEACREKKRLRCLNAAEERIKAKENQGEDS